MNDVEKNKFTVKTKQYPKSQTSINLVEQIKQPIELKIKKFDNINRHYFIREVDSIYSNTSEEYNGKTNKNFSFLNEANILKFSENGKKLIKPNKIPEFFINPVLTTTDSSLNAFSTKTHTNISDATESTLFYNTAKFNESKKTNQISEFYLKPFNVTKTTNSNEATPFYNQSKNKKATKAKQIPEFFIKPKIDLNVPESSTNSSKLSFTSESIDKKNNEKSTKKSNQIIDKKTVDLVNTLERTNTNVYFWYYKNNECQRNSCKIKIRFPKLDKENNNNSEFKVNEKLKKHKKDRNNDSTVRCMSPNQKHLTDSMKYFLEEKSVVASSSHTGLNTSRIDYYKTEQEKLNNIHFIPNQKSSFSNQSNKTTSETLEDLFYDFETPLPDVEQVKKAKARSNLTVAELKSLSVSDKFIEEAKKMVFIPEANAFHPKFRYYYKKE